MHAMQAAVLAVSGLGTQRIEREPPKWGPGRCSVVANLPSWEGMTLVKFHL